MGQRKSRCAVALDLTCHPRRLPKIKAGFWRPLSESGVPSHKGQMGQCRLTTASIQVVASVFRF